MRNLTAWEVETQELLERVKKEIEEVKAEADKKIAFLMQRQQVLEESIKAYIEMKGSEPTNATKTLTEKDVKGKTYREILRMIALRNDKLLIVRHAIKRMKELNVFGDAGYPESTVYSTLNRNPEFQKVSKGIYRLNGYERKTHKIRASGKTSGVTKAIRELKIKNPLITKVEALRLLVDQHFDFKGKNPSNAVTMAWNSLGYSKEGKQQPLLT